MMTTEIMIIGCTGKVDSVDDFIKKARKFLAKDDTLLQFMDADKVLGREHVFSAWDHAKRAFERESNVSSTMAMEVLIYTSGETHIANALKKIGIKDGCERLAVISDGDLDIDELLGYLNLKRDDEVLICTESKLREFGIGENEISAVDKDKIDDLILEKVAMVDVKK
ncbi:MAG: hypothetical protein JSV56_07640 [Methanomassiliicoccales archaeon]|nr:MAG: hypothetical protein JSV56_07640 [Methanomassiliicoccales archaeon]